MSSKTKFTFVLKGIKPLEIDEIYKINIETNIDNDNLPKNVTKINELNTNETFNFSYLDESKKNHKCSVTMVNILGQSLPQYTDIHCFWDKHSFDNIPIGCPIKFVSPTIVKSYFSEITKDNYSIRENISNIKKQELLSIINNTIEDKSCKKIDLIDTEYYQTDGIFCSFNCLLSFIDDNSINPLYYNSKNLLLKMYKDYFGKIGNIEKAPHWRLLKSYGGHLSIDDFRNSFYKIEYISTGNTLSNIPKCIPIGHIFEEKPKF
jgi:hypothetical protein